ncbi:MAG: ImmA/IrrE family metallo-endopeptidase [archaeon]|nr:ImmA/IrrE family metallo-endopeptidase [archaeon]
MRRIIEKANEIRKKYGPDDLDFVAEKFGAEVVEEPLGKIIKEVYFKDLKVIVVDPNLHPYKKRHLIAHGLAHHLFHRDRRVNYFREEKDSLEGYLNDLKLKNQEKEAEIFAAYLLIPEEKLNAVLKEEWVRDSPDPIPELAEEFQVSPNFMRKRLEFKELSKSKV